MTLVIAGVDITAVHLARARMYDTADAAALDAADALSEGALYRRGLGDEVEVSTTAVLDAASAYLTGRDRPPQVAAWRLDSGTGSPDGRSARVVLTGSVHLPLAGAVVDRFTGPVQVTVESVASARVDTAG